MGEAMYKQEKYYVVFCKLPQTIKKCGKQGTWQRKIKGVSTLYAKKSDISVYDFWLMTYRFFWCYKISRYNDKDHPLHLMIKLHFGLCFCTHLNSPNHMTLVPSSNLVKVLFSSVKKFLQAKIDASFSIYQLFSSKCEPLLICTD